MFIKLTRWAASYLSQAHHDSIYVNSALMKAFYPQTRTVCREEAHLKMPVKDRPSETYTCIWLGDDEDTGIETVVETPEQILALIGETPNA